MNLTLGNVSGFIQDGQPDTHSVQTQVLLNNGDTLVLGGIYQPKHNNTENQVPVRVTWR